MADFNVAIRSGYRDISRLCLDLRPGDWTLSSDRKVIKWRNAAPPAWSSSFRFGDAARVVHARRPGVIGDAVRFRAALQTGLVVPVAAASADTEGWTFAWEFSPGLTSPQQPLLYGIHSSNRLSVDRIGPDGVNHSFQTDAGLVTSADGDMVEGVYLLAFDGAGAAALYRDNATVNSGVADSVQFTDETLDDEVGALAIGYDAAGRHLDGDLRSLRVWNRVLCPKEMDLVFQSLGADTSAGVPPDPRASVEVRSWVDGTGDLTQRQARRVNPLGGRHQRFRCAVSDEAAAIVQIACETAGDVLQDADLGGDLYTMSSIERASAAEPTVTQDAGWSSIFDVRLAASGHYTFLIARPNHGAVYVHLDAEIG